MANEFLLSDQQWGGLSGMLAAFSSGYSDSNAQSSSSIFKSNQLKLNAQLADLQGASVLTSADNQAAMVGNKVRTVESAQRANYASQGVDVNTGSPTAVAESTGEQGALAQQTIRENAWKEAWGFKVEASNFRSEAEMTALEGKQESENTLLGGITRGLTFGLEGFK